MKAGRQDTENSGWAGYTTGTDRAKQRAAEKVDCRWQKRAGFRDKHLKLPK